MQAVQFSEFSKEGDFSVLTLNTLTKPTVTNQPSSAVIKVHAAAINPVDTYVLKGVMASIGWPAPLPFTPGYDFSGVVESVSDDVSDFKVGDEVYGCHWGPVSHTDEYGATAGTFAEFVAVPVRSLLKKPSNLSHTQAAAIACVGMTATGPFDKTNIGQGSKVLILGGSTAVGMLAIQLAKLKGAWVATTSSVRSLDFVSQFGADKIINYNDTKWWVTAESGLSDLDAVFDCTGEADLFDHVRTEGLVKHGGSFVTVSSHAVGFDPTAHQPRFAFAAFVNSATCYESAKQDRLAALVADGTVKAPVENVYPFTQQGAFDIFTKIASGKSLGKQ
eukprot:gene29285-36308_t